MATKIEDLNKIALNYHLNENISDMHIENICQEYFIQWLVKKIKVNSNVLELGYGDGIVTRALFSADCHLTLIEGSELLANLAKESHPGINCQITLFENYKPESQFDFVLAAHVLEHLDDPIAILTVMRDWVRDDGKLILVVPNRNSIHRQLSVLMGLQPELDTLSQRDLLVGHQRVYSIELLEEHAKKAGFNVIDKAGFFIKMLPNSMMLDYSKDLLWGMNEISEKLPVNLAANICLVLQK
jgi:2-polyprenyl-3-methyl-5-hydroxy-6-metoxy-1,4-benzoquinol methylase